MSTVILRTTQYETTRINDFSLVLSLGYASRVIFQDSLLGGRITKTDD